MIHLTRKQYENINKVLQTKPELAKEFKEYSRESPLHFMSYLPLIEARRINSDKLLDIKLKLTKDELDQVSNIISR